jgi:aryl-alcohol dehydrogenase
MNADTNILAAVAEHAGAPFTLERVELGECRADEVVVDIRAVGICHTDLLARAGAFPTPLPAVLGHEGAGGCAAWAPRSPASSRETMSR